MSFLLLARKLSTIYPYVTYLFKMNGKIFYIGYTTNLYNRLCSHLSRGELWDRMSVEERKIRFLQDRFQKLSTAKNVTIHVSLLLDEYTLHTFFLPETIGTGASFLGNGRVIGEDGKLKEVHWKQSSECFYGETINFKNKMFHSFLAGLIWNRNVSKPSRNYEEEKLICIQSGSTRIGNWMPSIPSDFRAWCYGDVGKCSCIPPCQLVILWIPKEERSEYREKLLQQRQLHLFQPEMGHLIYYYIFQ